MDVGSRFVPVCPWDGLVNVHIGWAHAAVGGCRPPHDHVGPARARRTMVQSSVCKSCSEAEEGVLEGGTGCHPPRDRVGPARARRTMVHSYVCKSWSEAEEGVLDRGTGCQGSTGRARLAGAGAGERRSGSEVEEGVERGRAGCRDRGWQRSGWEEGGYCSGLAEGRQGDLCTGSGSE